MTQLIARARQFIASQSGAVAIEYGLIAAAMFLAIYPAFFLITSALGVKFQNVAAAFSFFN
jgi:Flp pilus assembly pilin Flp